MSRSCARAKRYFGNDWHQLGRASRRDLVHRGAEMARLRFFGNSHDIFLGGHIFRMMSFTRA